MPRNRVSVTANIKCLCRSLTVGKYTHWVSYLESSHIKVCVSPLVSLSSMWLFLWLADSSDASCCHSKPPHSGSDLLTLPETLWHNTRTCFTPWWSWMALGPWHAQPSWLFCSRRMETKRVLWRFWKCCTSLIPFLFEKCSSVHITNALLNKVIFFHSVDWCAFCQIWYFSVTYLGNI